MCANADKCATDWPALLRIVGKTLLTQPVRTARKQGWKRGSKSIELFRIGAVPHWRPALYNPPVLKQLMLHPDGWLGSLLWLELSKLF